MKGAIQPLIDEIMDLVPANPKVQARVAKLGAAIIAKAEVAALWTEMAKPPSPIEVKGEYLHHSMTNRVLVKLTLSDGSQLAVKHDVAAQYAYNSADRHGIAQSVAGYLGSKIGAHIADLLAPAVMNVLTGADGPYCPKAQA